MEAFGIKPAVKRVLLSSVKPKFDLTGLDKPSRIVIGNPEDDRNYGKECKMHQSLKAAFLVKM
jgi:hypothetical protein